MLVVFASLVLGVGVTGSGRRYKVVQGDILVPSAADERGAETQSAYRGQLWEDPKAIPYETESALASDERIRDAIEHYRTHTCIRFKRRSGERDFIKFVVGTGCKSFVGRVGRENTIILDPKCSVGTVIHEIGHALGLVHEQSREDRDSYVIVDLNNLANESTARNFYKSSDGVIGPYDYGSIMHYGAHDFAKGDDPVILAPKQIGQRNGLSEGDKAGLDFLYNGCKAPSEITAPSCIPSLSTDVVHNIAFSKPFTVRFVSRYKTSITGTTFVDGAAPSASSFPGGIGEATLVFTPGAARIGSETVLSATFRGSDGASTDCSVRVQAVNADAVCFGSVDPEACGGGKGVCRADGVCECTAPFAGATCGGVETCLATTQFGFDDDAQTGVAMRDAEVKTDASFAGGASLQIRDRAVISSRTFLKPGRITFWMRHKGGTSFSGLNAQFNGTRCLGIAVRCKTSGSCDWTLQNPGTAPQFYNDLVYPDEWQFVDIILRHDSRNVVVNVNGRTALADTAWACGSGLTHSIFFGTPTGTPVPASQAMDIDEVNYWCVGHVTATGTLGTAQHTDLSAGGRTIVLQLSTGEAWKTDAASVQAVLDSLKPEDVNPGSGEGWEANRAALLSTSRVTVSAGTMTIALGAAAGYRSQVDEVITAAIPAASTVSGEAPTGLVKYAIPGSCGRSLFDTSTYTGGAGSVATALFLSRHARFQPESVAFSFGVGSGDFVVCFNTICSFQLNINRVSGTALCAEIDSTKTCAPSGTSFVTGGTGTPNAVRVDFDWTRNTGVLSVPADSAARVTFDLPRFGITRFTIFTNINSTDVRLSNIEVRCPPVSPAVDVASSLSDVRFVGQEILLTYKFGTTKLSTSDFAGATEGECTSLTPGGAGTGAVKHHTGGSMKWYFTVPAVGVYKLCYYSASFGVWLQARDARAGGFAAIRAVEPTPAPPTPVPTPAPSTLAPPPTPAPTAVPTTGLSVLTIRLSGVFVNGNCEQFLQDSALSALFIRMCAGVASLANARAALSCGSVHYAVIGEVAGVGRADVADAAEMKNRLDTQLNSPANAELKRVLGESGAVALEVHNSEGELSGQCQASGASSATVLNGECVPVSCSAGFTKQVTAGNVQVCAEDDDDDDDDSDGERKWLIAVIVAAVAVGVLLAVAVYCSYFKKERVPNGRPDEENYPSTSSQHAPYNEPGVHQKAHN